MKTSVQKGKISKYRRWTPEEDLKLISLYEKKTLFELAEIFNRHWNKICRRAMRLGIKKSSKARGMSISIGQKETFKNGRLHMGYNNPNWKGVGQIDTFGYHLTYCPNHPHAIMNNRYVRTHRLVIESNIGRYLKPTEVVHHINHNRLDNRLENLRLLSGHLEHRLIHLAEKTP